MVAPGKRNVSRPGIRRFPEVSNSSQLDEAVPAAPLTEMVGYKVRGRLLRLCQGEGQASGGSAKVRPLRWAWGLRDEEPLKIVWGWGEIE